MKLRRADVIAHLEQIRDGLVISERTRKPVCNGLIAMLRGATFNQAFSGHTAGQERSEAWKKIGLEYAVRLRLKQRPAAAQQIIGDRLKRLPDDIRVTLQPHREADEARLTAILETAEALGHDRDTVLRDMLRKWFPG